MDAEKSGEENVMERAMGMSNGKEQWERVCISQNPEIQQDNGNEQWDRTLGKRNGKEQWERAMGKEMGTTTATDNVQKLIKIEYGTQAGTGSSCSSGGKGKADWY